MTHIAILDDSQHVALRTADWAPLRAKGAMIDVLHEPDPNRRENGTAPLERNQRMVANSIGYFGKTKVPRLAFAVPVDPTLETSCVFDLAGERRRVGDRWSEAIDDLDMNVAIDTRYGALQVILTFRIDSFKDRDWLAAEAMPMTIAVVPWAPLVGFAIEIDGVHACGIYPIGADPADALAVRDRLFGDAKKTLVIVGLSQDKIRLLKRGMHLERVFEIFADTCARTSPKLQERDYLEALDILTDPPDVLFKEAMATYFGSAVA